MLLHPKAIAEQLVWIDRSVSVVLSMLPSWQPVLPRTPHHALYSFYYVFFTEAHIRGRNSNWLLCFPVGSLQQPVMKLYGLKNTNSARKHTWIANKINWYIWAEYLWFSSHAALSRYDDDINCMRVSCRTSDQVSFHTLDGFLEFPVPSPGLLFLCAVWRAPLWAGGSTTWPLCVISTFRCL